MLVMKMRSSSPANRPACKENLCAYMYKKKKKKQKKKTRIDVYETLCPQQMLVHKGGKIKNWGGECRDVTPTKLQSQNIFKREH